MTTEETEPPDEELTMLVLRMGKDPHAEANGGYVRPWGIRMRLADDAGRVPADRDRRRDHDQHGGK